jgi:hypothetical protein
MYLSKPAADYALGSATDDAAGLITGPCNASTPSARGHTVAVLGEFTRTISFLFFAFVGTEVANISNTR